MLRSVGPPLHASQQYSKKSRNFSIIPNEITKEAAVFDLLAEEKKRIVVSSKSKEAVKTHLPMGIPIYCYSRIGPRSGMAVRTHVGIRAVFIGKHYNGEIGAVLCNRFEEDLPVKLGDSLDQ